MFLTRYLVLVPVLFTVTAANADTLNVPDPIPSIQLAIDLAVDGDEVVIAEDLVTGW